MPKFRSSLNRLLATAAVAGLLAVPACAQQQQPPRFGQAEDVNFARALWTSLTSANLVGGNAYTGKPYAGVEPHGAILTTVDGPLSVGGRQATVVVKTNFMGPGVTAAAVANDPAKFLDAYTVMFKRETGYDAQNQNWFWVKFRKDGSVDAGPDGVGMAGRVGMCTGCHVSAPGKDFLFIHDRLAGR